MKTTLCLIMALAMCVAFETDEKHFSNKQKKAMEMAAKEANKNKLSAMRLMKT